MSRSLDRSTIVQKTWSTNAVRVDECDMTEEMEKAAVEVAMRVVRKSPKDAQRIAMEMKKRFDDLYGRAWHCAVGCQFSSFVTHEPGTFIYMYSKYFGIVLYKCGL